MTADSGNKVERESVDSNRRHGRLLNFIIAKAVMETLFVAALAVSFYLTAFNPFFRGWVDAANSERVEGWAVNQLQPGAPVEVQLYIDGNFVASRSTNIPRPDVAASGHAPDNLHGFVFETPRLDVGEHEARVYIVHASGEGVRRTMRLIGKPVRFSVNGASAGNVETSR